MQIENFILSSGFFDKSVIRLPEKEIASSLFTGSNQKKILIVSLVESENQTDDNLFLKKVMESVKINLSEDASLFVLPKNKSFNWNSITKQVEFTHLVFFGNSLKNIGLQLDFKLYTPFQFQEKELMVAEPLSAIANERAKKGALWNALKLMFVKEA